MGNLSARFEIPAVKRVSPEAAALPNKCGSEDSPSNLSARNKNPTNIRDRTTSKILPIPGIKQEQSNGCWGVCAAMVFRHFGIYGVNTDSSACNKPCQWKDIKKFYSHWNIRSKLNKGTVTFSTIVSEIDAARPVEIGYEWIGGDGHVVLVIGYKMGSRNRTSYLYVNDPLNGNGWQLYSDIKRPEVFGKWRYTWTSISP